MNSFCNTVFVTLYGYLFQFLFLGFTIILKQCEAHCMVKIQTPIDTSFKVLNFKSHALGANLRSTPALLRVVIAALFKPGIMTVSQLGTNFDKL